VKLTTNQRNRPDSSVHPVWEQVIAVSPGHPALDDPRLRRAATTRWRRGHAEVSAVAGRNSRAALEQVINNGVSETVPPVASVYAVSRARMRVESSVDARSGL
jgi:hypothetical protein